jgi:glucan endo-1,3-beta-D-glucosidase/glucan 1,3-beta-glucosidase
MKFSTSAWLSSLIALASLSTNVYSFGINIGHTRRDGSCKVTADWKGDFLAVKSWPTPFTVVKLFSTSDCQALDQAVPAAIEAGVKLWVGIWNVPSQKFAVEKDAVVNAFKKYPQVDKWLAGFNVGSESFYRKELTGPTLATQIYDVRGMIKAIKPPNVSATFPVGTADTWTSWVNPGFADVIKASDVCLMNAFPYWQATPIQGALAKLQEAIQNTRNAIGNKPFVLGETGWSSAGANFGPAVPSPANQQAFWKSAGCWLKKQPFQWFWFSAFNEPHRDSEVERNFGIAKAIDRSLKINLTCP